jgi:hypothetical protein
LNEEKKKMKKKKEEKEKIRIFSYVQNVFSRKQIQRERNFFKAVEIFERKR